MRYLVEQGADLEIAETRRSKTCLMVACHRRFTSSEQVDIVRYLLEKGAKVNGTNWKGIYMLIAFMVICDVIGINCCLLG